VVFFTRKKKKSRDNHFAHFKYPLNQDQLSTDAGGVRDSLSRTNYAHRRKKEKKSGRNVVARENVHRRRRQRSSRANVTGSESCVVAAESRQSLWGRDKKREAAPRTRSIAAQRQAQVRQDLLWCYAEYNLPPSARCREREREVGWGGSMLFNMVQGVDGPRGCPTLLFDVVQIAFIFYLFKAFIGGISSVSFTQSKCINAVSGKFISVVFSGGGRFKWGFTDIHTSPTRMTFQIEILVEITSCVTSPASRGGK